MEPEKIEIKKERIHPESIARDYPLIQRVLGTDSREAYADLVNYYKDAIHFRIFEMVGNKDDAADLTQEVFIKAYVKLGTYNPEYAFYTWLHRIAVNQCIDYHRARKMKTVSMSEQTTDGRMVLKEKVFGGPKDPEEKMLQEQRRLSVLDALEQLKPRYKEIMKLRYLYELSYGEIVEKLKMPLGTVKTRLCRGRRLLGKILYINNEDIRDIC